jgi:hypothetical protein
VPPRAPGVAAELANWRAGTTAALAEPEQTLASPRATHADRKRIEQFDRDLQRKDRAPAEPAPLLVLSRG